MKLATFLYEQNMHIGLVQDRVNRIIDLTEAAPDLPQEMSALLATGLTRAREVEAHGRTRRIPLPLVHLLAPVLRPPKFLGIGFNFTDHMAEGIHPPYPIPAGPIVFTKQSTCVTGPTDPICLPHSSQQVDYEGELGIVIGRRCRLVSREQAQQVIAGYLVVNDVSVRDWQIPSPTLGKSFDSHGPIGPWIVTADELQNPHDLAIQTWVNGEQRQHGNTRDLIYDCFTLVEMLSSRFTLEPGDIIATGTPSGIGATLGKYLTAGDVVRVSIEHIGTIENHVVESDPL